MTQMEEEMESVVPDPGEQEVIDKASRIGPIGAVVVIASTVAIAFYAQYRSEIVIVLLLYSLLLVLYNLVYCAIGRLFGVEVEEFSLFFGGYLLRFNVGSVPVRINWFPLGGAVKFRGVKFATSSEQEPSSGAYHQLHPLQRALLALSAPLVLVLMSLVLLGPIGFIAWTSHDLQKALTALGQPEAERIVRDFLMNVRSSSGILGALGYLAAFLGIMNLLPVGFFSGGVALAEVFGWLRLRPVVKFNELLVGPLALALLVFVGFWAVPFARVVFVR